MQSAPNQTVKRVGNDFETTNFRKREKPRRKKNSLKNLYKNIVQLYKI
jgi:hypothetical protein